MRGRKKTPTVINFLRGNPGKRPINHEEPKPDPLVAECPAELTDQVEREEWERTIVPAIRIGQITVAERALAIGHCVQWAVWRSQVTEASQHPHVIAAGKNKYPMPNPARTMANATYQLLRQTDSDLGLTPTTRSRVQTKGAPSTTQVDRQRRKFFEVGRG